MWRICRKTGISQLYRLYLENQLFPRWHVNRQKPVENRNQSSPCTKTVALYPVTGKKNYQDYDKKQHADKQGKRCWDDPNFHYDSFRCLLLETAGWVGTAAAICINIHLKHLKHILDHDKPSSCLFSRNVLAMPKLHFTKETVPAINCSIPDVSVPRENIPVKEEKVSSDINIKTIRDLSDEYVAAVENAVGISSLKRNEKRAFRCFQTAARLGSAQALYNLGLCYESGRGIKMNLQRAAFCYRKAAMKGHGLASFNLAVFFMKGMGGLPVDTETARLLLAEAAEQGVLQAQLYLGIDLLENRKYTDAYVIFENLAQENCSDAQYYLGLCFENGWGTQKSEKMAAQFYSKAANQGHSEASEKLKIYSEKQKPDHNYNNPLSLSLLHMLRQYNENSKSIVLLTYQNIKYPVHPPEQSKRSILHVSASDPELTASVKTLPHTTIKQIPAPSYLDLTSHVSNKNGLCKPKASFSIGDDSVSKECLTSFVLNSPSVIPQIMSITT